MDVQSDYSSCAKTFVVLGLVEGFQYGLCYSGPIQGMCQGPEQAS